MYYFQIASTINKSKVINFELIESCRLAVTIALCLIAYTSWNIPVAACVPMPDTVILVLSLHDLNVILDFRGIFLSLVSKCNFDTFELLHYCTCKSFVQCCGQRGIVEYFTYLDHIQLVVCIFSLDLSVVTAVFI